MILEQDCWFQTTTTYWRECMEQIQMSIPEYVSENPPRNRIKKYINKSLTRIFRANNDKIGIVRQQVTGLNYRVKPKTIINNQGN